MIRHDRVETIEQLREIYSAPSERARTKEIDHLSAGYRRMIEASPFAVLATVGPDGLDVSPRGDAPGFVHVADERTLLLPDRRGNNRIDSLLNLVHDPRLSLLFLIPGAGETLRINGRAEISVDAELRASFAVDGKEPASVLVIRVERAFFQCARAVVRSRLWDETRHVATGSLPSAGSLLKEIDSAFDARSHDAAAPDRLRKTLY